MSTEFFSCQGCSLVTSITINSCGPWRGYWVDIATNDLMTGRQVTLLSHHALFRFTANAYSRFMKHHILTDLKRCPGA